MATLPFHHQNPATHPAHQTGRTRSRASGRDAFSFLATREATYGRRRSPATLILAQSAEKKVCARGRAAPAYPALRDFWTGGDSWGEFGLSAEHHAPRKGHRLPLPELLLPDDVSRSSGPGTSAAPACDHL